MEKSDMHLGFLASIKTYIMNGTKTQTGRIGEKAQVEAGRSILFSMI